MAKNGPDRSGKAWTPAEVRQLKGEIKGNTPTRVMALHLGRSTEASSRKPINLVRLNEASGSSSRR